MSEAVWFQNYLAVGAILFGIGLVGFLVRRNLIVMFLCAEMMLQGISLTLTACGRFHDDWGGQMMVIFIITVAACEAGIALALVLMLCQQAGNLDVAKWQTVREEGVAEFVNEEIPEDADGEKLWPQLTPAGVKPESLPEREKYRSRT